MLLPFYPCENRRAPTSFFLIHASLGKEGNRLNRVCMAHAREERPNYVRGLAEERGELRGLDEARGWLASEK
jgi:hypothetical protein